MTIKDLLKKDYDYVVYRIKLDDKLAYEVGKKSIFAGIFQIKDGQIISLDGDTYNSDEEVIDYKEWSDATHKNALTITVA